MRALKTRALGFVSSLFLLTSCAFPTKEWIAEQDNERIARDQASAQAAAQTAKAAKLAALELQVGGYVGQSQWVAQKDQLLVCPRLTDLKDCNLHFGHFKVDGYQPFVDDRVWLQVTFDGAPTGWTDISPHEMRSSFRPYAPLPETTIYPSFLDHLPKKLADERRKLPGITLGMNAIDVLGGAWGKPQSSRVWETRKGRREEWYYPDDNALYFRDGKLYGFKN